MKHERRPELADLHRRWIKHPLMQDRVAVSPREASGGAELAWYRGHQAGVHDVYKKIRKNYPKAAKALLAAFQMNPDGTLGLR